MTWIELFSKGFTAFFNYAFTVLMQMGEAGIIPSLLKMLNWDSIEAQDCSTGALANLAASPQCKSIIAEIGLPPIFELINRPGTEEHIIDMAVGTIGNLATIKSNQVRGGIWKPVNSYIHSQAGSNSVHVWNTDAWPSEFQRSEYWALVSLGLIPIFTISPAYWSK